MIFVRKSNERGNFNFGWLDTFHTFSFADYYDPSFMGFRDLRVINEDRIQPGQGFPTHSHRDMEIITYVISGRISHKDSMGNSVAIHAGEVQRMTAGKGVLHSEFSDPNEMTHLLQIWILPEKRGLEPSYEQKRFPREVKLGRLCPIADPKGTDGPVKINQDLTLYASILESGQNVVYPIAPGRGCWIQLISGELEVNDTKLHPGDGAAISEETQLSITAAGDNTEFLLFDLR